MRIGLRRALSGLGDNCGAQPSDAVYQASGKSHAQWLDAYYAWVNCVNAAQNPALNCPAGTHWEGSIVNGVVSGSCVVNPTSTQTTAPPPVSDYNSCIAAGGTSSACYAAWPPAPTPTPTPTPTPVVTTCPTGYKWVNDGLAGVKLMQLNRMGVQALTGMGALGSCQLITAYTDAQLIAGANTMAYDPAKMLAAQITRIQPQVTIPKSVNPGTLLAFMLGLGGTAAAGTISNGADGKQYQMQNGTWKNPPCGSGYVWVDDGMAGLGDLGLLRGCNLTIIPDTSGTVVTGVDTNGNPVVPVTTATDTSQTALIGIGIAAALFFMTGKH